MTILLRGCNGNMGRRYAAIMRAYKIPFEGVDLGDVPGLPYDEYSGVVCATPTTNHVADIQYHALMSDKPLLVEKPVSKEYFELPKDIKIMMVNQYRFMLDKEDTSQSRFVMSYYDYFKSGADGIEWDCINIVGLSNGEIKLSNGSPIWKCMINNTTLNIANMDSAYCENIVHFAENKTKIDWGFERNYIYIAHSKVLEILGGGKYETD